MSSDIIYNLAVATVVVILIFDYTNGFHDASNIIGTVIASRAMTPIQSVIIVATFEFLGPLLGGTAVANTIGGIAKISDLTPTLSMTVVFCGMLGSIFWNLLTWWFGIPSSSSHALVGGLVGAVLFAAGADHVVWGVDALMEKHKLTGVTKTVAALIISPLAAFWTGFFFFKLMRWLLMRAKPSANNWLKRSQFFTMAALAFSHGSNDAQKSMGIVALILMLGGMTPKFEIPFWVMLACSIVITLGILSGGWRIVRTIGFGIYKVRPLHAMSAQLTSAALILGASQFGMPVSTTHVASSAIMGVGSSERAKDVRWSKASEIVSTWIITIPGSGLVGALSFAFAKYVLGVH
ncbi:inorganic phosphate transporter [Candidatus Magnetaquicoccus inordinatus]|uniref:inorganic phosphate transporter n=1 Tax=Candidatus Magnetaquicoccus inordinatus TaxID=2496818 RepID=UPI00102AA368|nr:inorganic phosphate transporter [Candidatus Magnetaquicoccus inordinatus]